MSTLKATWWLIPIAIGTLPLSYRAIEDLQKMPPPGHVNAQGDLVVNPDSYRDSTAELPGTNGVDQMRSNGKVNSEPDTVGIRRFITLFASMDLVTATRRFPKLLAYR